MPKVTIHGHTFITHAIMMEHRIPLPTFCKMLYIYLKDMLNVNIPERGNECKMAL